jgi:hypothetical protein
MSSNLADSDLFRIADSLTTCCFRRFFSLLVSVAGTRQPVLNLGLMRFSDAP